MNYTHAQLLELTGMTLDRLRHWRKEIPGLNERAGRRGELSFEEISLLAVLSNGADVLALPVGLFAPHYSDLLAAFQDNPEIGEPNIVLWVTEGSAKVGDVSRPPEGEVSAMLRIAPVLTRVIQRVQKPGMSQLKLSFEDAR